MISNDDLDHLLVGRARRGRGGRGDRARRVRRRPQRSREGPGRLGERRRHRERARSARCARTTPRPSVAFFGEESGGERADVGWFVDPLDGTANFVHGFPVVGVSIGLVADGEPVVGVVHAPLLGDTYSARRGGGAFRNGEPIRVSDRPSVSAICATGFPFRAKRERLDGYLPVFERALRTFEDLRRAGAASLDLAWTAAGVFDGYFEPALGDLGRRGRGPSRSRGGWRGDRLVGRRSGVARRPATSWPRPHAVHAGLLELMAM